MINYHKTEKGDTVAEILPESEIINSAEDILDIMAEAGYNGCTGLIIHANTLNRDFFDLKTKLAGEILQKFSNYRMKLAIIGDFSDVKSKSLRDFIRESNNMGTIYFVGSMEEAMVRLNK
jgi:sugar phosphate isomerase/epimerase